MTGAYHSKRGPVEGCPVGETPIRDRAWTDEQIQQADACYRRCRRMHANCELRIGRILAPDDYWRWVVTMPDGHLWDSSGKSFDSPFDCLFDAREAGFSSLMAADKAWRDSHSPDQGATP